MAAAERSELACRAADQHRGLEGVRLPVRPQPGHGMSLCPDSTSPPLEQASSLMVKTPMFQAAQLGSTADPSLLPT